MGISKWNTIAALLLFLFLCNCNIPMTVPRWQNQIAPGRLCLITLTQGKNYCKWKKTELAGVGFRMQPPNKGAFHLQPPNIGKLIKLPQRGWRLCCLEQKILLEEEKSLLSSFSISSPRKIAGFSASDRKEIDSSEPRGRTIVCCRLCFVGNLGGGWRY